MKKIIINQFLSLKVFLIVMIFILPAFNSFAQNKTIKTIKKEVDIKILSWTKTNFDKPIRIGVGKRIIEYKNAVVLKLQVSRDQFDSLPPDIEPFLYIGPEEYRVFQIERTGNKEITLIFHIRNLEKLKDGWPIVLTIDHGAPIREQKRFDIPDIPRFSVKDIKDNEN